MLTSRYEPGKYEREALVREARDLHYRRRMRAGGLSQSEAQRLDAIESIIGEIETFPPKGNSR